MTVSAGGDYFGGRFKATFRNRQMDGFFVEIRVNGDKLIGNIKNGKYEGKVTMYSKAYSKVIN